MITPEFWARVEPILDRTLDLPPEARDAFLQQACGDDAELRREVETLVRSSEMARESILDRPAADLALVQLALAGHLLGEPGERLLDRYDLIRPLGVGGMGMVFLARDRTLDRPVALKFLPPHVASDPEAIRRFRDEARAASALDHPNIATVHDIAEAEDGRHFIVMGFYEGETLRDRVDRGPMPVHEAVPLAAQVAGALAAAHAAGIVHRDIKPSNILVTGDGRARILDFGVAKVAGQTPTRASGITGTLPYMSPEQTRGEEMDGRSDIWSLGVALYEMLTGRRPFPADTAEALIQRIREDPPPPLRELSPEVPERVAQIVQRCLEKDPDRRFPDAESLRRALVTTGVGEQAGTGEPSRERGTDPSRLRPVAILVGSAIAFAGLLVLGYTTLRDRPTPPPDGVVMAPAGSAAPVRIAVLPFAVRGDERFEYLEEGMVELLSTQLDRAGPLRTVHPRALLAFLRGDGRDPVSPERVDGRAVARRFDAALFLSGSIVEVGGRLRVRAALYDAQGQLQTEVSSDARGEGELLDLVDRLARQLIGSQYPGETGRLTRIAAATTASIGALKAYLEGDRWLREGQYDQALMRFREAVAQDSAFALAWYRMAVAAEWSIRPDIARAAADRAVQLASTLPEHDRLLVTGWNAYATGASVQAERIYRRILDRHPDNVEAWLQLGEVLFHYGPLDGRPLGEARPAFEQVLAFEPRHEGALLHLARIAAREGASDALDRWVNRLLAAHPGSEIAVEARALRAFAAGDPAARQAVIRELRDLGSDAVFTAIWTVSYTHDPAAVEDLARLLAREGRPEDVRAAGHLLLATAELAQGRWRRAQDELMAAQRLNPAWALELGALYAASGIVPGSLAGLDSLRNALNGWEPLAVPPSVDGGAFLTAHDHVHHRLKSYLTGLLDASIGEVEATLAVIPDLRRREGPPWADMLASNLARELQADVLSREGRKGDALALLEASRTHSAYALAVASPFHAAARERFLRAGLLAELGRPQEALAFFTSLGDGSVYDLPFLAPAHLRVAALLEELGQAERAAEHYRRFVELWRDADPEFRPAVEEARRKAAQRAPGG